MFVNVAVEFPLPHDPAHEAAAAHKRSMEAIIREIAGYAGASHPQALAEELSIVIEGAYVTRQVSGNRRTADIARRVVDRIVESHLPEGRA